MRTQVLTRTFGGLRFVFCGDYWLGPRGLMLIHHPELRDTGSPWVVYPAGGEGIFVPMVCGRSADEAVRTWVRLDSGWELRRMATIARLKRKRAPKKTKPIRAHDLKGKI